MAFAHGTTEDIVLASRADARLRGLRPRRAARARRRVTELPPFHNEPVLDLTQAAHRDELRESLAWLDGRLPLAAPIWIGNERRDGRRIVSTDPADPERVVAHAPIATAAEVTAAVGTAERGYRQWAAVPARERAAVLSRAAAWLRERRATFAALCVREAGKPWAEADADVCQAIDFLEFYARGAVALGRGRALFQVPGERNGLHYVPRGIVAAIAPWNYPIAIPAGMIAAGLATGNAVVFKPAEQTPLCGLVLVEALRDAGVPPDALGLIHGGAETGAALVREPRVATIAFTGSSRAGLDILAATSTVADGQRQLKRAIVDMGGKNCIIVDEDADLDSAIEPIVHSAFAYSGQKCSTASRLLVHEAIADELIERLAVAVEALEVGAPEEFGTVVGPVIDRRAQARVAHYAQHAATSGQVVAHRVPQERPERGWYCPPTVIADVHPGAAVLHEEVLGPLLTVERVLSIDDACHRIDTLPYALTGGLFTRSQDTVEHVVACTPVGNLYVNRAITGAVVGRQPFGGNRLSGTGTKAGGPDYLLHFVEPLVVTETAMPPPARSGRFDPDRTTCESTPS
jgi:RHH-type proline utilization regulon transcriptional repressor/proline dehydrogenase/delta 1-pyrroline-5-carboxylate dehydrogenase